MSPFLPPFEDCFEDCCELTTSLIEQGQSTEYIEQQQHELILSKLDKLIDVIRGWNIPPRNLQDFAYWAMLQPYLNIIALRYGVNIGTVTPGPEAVTFSQGNTTGTTTDLDVTIFDEDVAGYFLGNISNTGGVNGLRYDVTQTSADGITTGTNFDTVPPGTNDSNNMHSDTPIAPCKTPITHVKVTVRTVVAGNFTTYNLKVVSGG